MDHRGAGKVKHSHRLQESAAPDPVARDRVHDPHEDEGKEDEEHINNIDGTPRIKGCLEEIEGIIKNIQLIEKSIYHDLQSGDSLCENWNIKYTYIDIGYDWASGIDFSIISSKYEIYEGNFIRSMLKINNLVQNIITLYKLYNDLQTIPQLEQISKLIYRSIVSIDSLYLRYLRAFLKREMDEETDRRRRRQCSLLVGGYETILKLITEIDKEKAKSQSATGIETLTPSQNLRSKYNDLAKKVDDFISSFKGLHQI